MLLSDFEKDTLSQFLSKHPEVIVAGILIPSLSSKIYWEIETDAVEGCYFVPTSKYHPDLYRPGQAKQLEQNCHHFPLTGFSMSCDQKNPYKALAVTQDQLAIILARSHSVLETHYLELEKREEREAFIQAYYKEDPKTRINLLSQSQSKYDLVRLIESLGRYQAASAFRALIPEIEQAIDMQPKSIYELSMGKS